MIHWFLPNKYLCSATSSFRARSATKTTNLKNYILLHLSQNVAPNIRRWRVYFEYELRIWKMCDAAYYNDNHSNITAENGIFIRNYCYYERLVIADSETPSRIITQKTSLRRERKNGAYIHCFRIRRTSFFTVQWKTARSNETIMFRVK